jgi:hypothetical protein
LCNEIAQAGLFDPHLLDCRKTQYLGKLNNVYYSTIYDPDEVFPEVFERKLHLLNLPFDFDKS